MHRYPFKIVLLFYSKLSNNFYSHSVKRRYSTLHTITSIILSDPVSYDCSLSRTPHQSHGPPCHSSNMLDMLSPQGLCTCCSLFLFPRDPYNSFSLLLQGFIKCHLLSHYLISNGNLAIPALLIPLPGSTAFVTVYHTIWFIFVYSFTCLPLVGLSLGLIPTS